MSPTILRTRNLRIKIYPRDHNPPHVHVVGPEGEEKFELNSLRCLSSIGFSFKALMKIKIFLKENKNVLAEARNENQK